jgi:hypothetical protein
LRSLRALGRRVEKFGEHRASTAEEQAWSGRLYDQLEAAFDQAMKSDAARASLTARDRRAAVIRKTSAKTNTPTELVSERPRAGQEEVALVELAKR